MEIHRQSDALSMQEAERQVIYHQIAGDLRVGDLPVLVYSHKRCLRKKGADAQQHGAPHRAVRSVAQVHHMAGTRRTHERDPNRWSARIQRAT